MEVKSSSRSNKKSAHGGPGTAGDRRKAKPKKKKDKRKPSLKGTESTDIPSPELDSEVPLDGDVTLTDQGGQCLLYVIHLFQRLLVYFFFLFRTISVSRILEHSVSFWGYLQTKE